MTATKRLGLAGTGLLSLGAAGAYYATLTTMKGQGSVGGGINCLVLAAVAALAAVVMAVFWRSGHRSIQKIALQIQAMARNGQISVLASEHNDLEMITRPLNELLDVTKRQLAQARAENRELQIQSRISSAEKRHTEAIIFSISDAVLVTNRFDELVLANEEAEKLLGFRLADGLRKRVENVLPDGTLVRLIQETRDRPGPSTRKVVEHTIDQKGQPRVFSITLSCVMTDHQEVSGVVAVLHDVTREKEVAKMKTDFVSAVSHELKTPLSSIKAYIEMLMDGEMPDEAAKRECYEIISNEANRLHKMIENILNISRIESGLVKVVREPLSLTELAKQVFAVAVPQAKAKDLQLVDKIAPVYCHVEADRDMIYQSIMNLVSNAIKYTPDGGTVTLVVQADERRNVAVCEVADTGAGIPADELPKIFDKFYRVKSNNKLAKGTGLGLALVKHMIETVHDGKISVTSEKDKGSTFRFELPLTTS